MLLLLLRSNDSGENGIIVIIIWFKFYEAVVWRARMQSHINYRSYAPDFLVEINHNSLRLRFQEKMIKKRKKSTQALKKSPCSYLLPHTPTRNRNINTNLCHYWGHWIWTYLMAWMQRTEETKRRTKKKIRNYFKCGDFYPIYLAITRLYNWLHLKHVLNDVRLLDREKKEVRRQLTQPIRLCIPLLFIGNKVVEQGIMN